MTQELQEYLKTNQLPFLDSELTEVVLMVYNLIEWGIRDHNPIIEVFKQAVIRRSIKDNGESKEFLTLVDFRPAFELVIERDNVVRQHLIVLDKTESKTTYRIE